MRKIIHIDMDAFYASIEQRDDPRLAGRPVAVGGSSHRGVVAAASYEARAYGVHSAMPSRVAARRCPDLIFIRPRFDVYRDVSHRIRRLFHSYTDLVEPLSLDEAYLDVTHPLRGPASATLIAEALRADIAAETGLTASAGVSFNKFLAKVASDVQKPDGLTVVTPAAADAFLTALPVERFYGVGPVSARRLRALGIETGADLRAWTVEALVHHFGKRGRYLHAMAHGRDDRPVQPHRERKSVGAEKTFGEDLVSLDAMDAALARLAGRVAERLERYGQSGACVTLKIRYRDFETLTRQTTLSRPVADADSLLALGTHLLRTPRAPVRPVRLLGLTASSLMPHRPQRRARQLVLPFPDDDAGRQEALPEQPVTQARPPGSDR